MDSLPYRALRLVLLAKLCVTFPVLIYGVDRADYLISYQFDGLDLWVVGLGIALAPGLALALVDALFRARLHAPLVAVLTFVALGQFVTWGLIVTGPAGLVTSAALAVFAYRYARVLPRSPLQALAVASLCTALPVYLVCFSELEVLARTPALPADPPAVTRPHPVVLVVLDAFPMPTLLDASGNIDGALYPAFAALGRESTFYRNATANHGYTNVSIPSLVSGRLPSDQVRPLPLAALHPDNVFNLLARDYRVHDTESGTRLCPENRPRTTRVGFPRLDRWCAVWYDLMLVLPMTLQGSLNDRQLGDLVQRLRFFGMERARKRDEDAFDRTALFRRYLDGIDGADPRTLYYLHACMPHDPWDHTPEGARYVVPGPLQGVRLGMHDPQHLFFYWTDDLHLIRLNYQRLLLQVMYTDRMVGELVARLKDKKVWDDALVIITSDHGSACLPGNLPRDAVRPDSPLVTSGRTRPNLSEVLAVPLFVKLPGQAAGATSDRNVELVDVLPTIADVLGVQVPWKVDGHSLATAVPERPTKTFFDFDFTRVPLPRRLADWDEPLKKRSDWFEPGPDWLWRVKPYGARIGQPASGAPTTVTWDAQPAGVLSGTVAAPAGSVLELVRAGKVTAAARVEEGGRFLTFERPAHRAPSPPDARIAKE